MLTTVIENSHLVIKTPDELHFSSSIKAWGFSHYGTSDDAEVVQIHEAHRSNGNDGQKTAHRGDRHMRPLPDGL